MNNNFSNADRAEVLCAALPYIKKYNSTSTPVASYGAMPSVEEIYDQGWLRGSLTPMTVEPGTGTIYRYGLQTQNGRQAFFLITSNTTMPAYYAYLEVDESMLVPERLGLGDDEATGITDVFDELNSGDAAIYDASGAKLNGLQKGMNIIKSNDGRVQKVYVK